MPSPSGTSSTFSGRIPEVGEVIAGKYRLKRLLGEGGMGSVMEAEHLKLRQPIAIKFLNPSMLGVDEIVQRFEREARAAATLRSRHVVRVTDVEVTSDGVPYMVMELLVGGDLESEREKRRHIPFAEAVNYVLQACGALAEAHDAGIIHRDLKPGNLFLAREDHDRVIVKVLDFGISKFLQGEDAKLTSAGAIMGTALYMSPEQIRGDESIDARSDIWSLGVILFELISGTAPFVGPTTRVAAAIVSEPTPELRAPTPVPEPLVQAIYRMLEKSPAKRFASIADVAAAIAPFALSGSIGLEVADQLARRSQRSLDASFAAQAARMSSAPTAAAQPPLTIPLVQAIGSEPMAVAASLPPTPPRVTPPNPERSTMAATTTNANMMKPRGRPRAVWGVLAGFGTLALAGIVLIAVVARSKGSVVTDTTNAASGSASPAVSPPASTPSIAADPATSSALAQASAAPSASTAPSSRAGAQAAAATPKKSGLAVREFPSAAPPHKPSNPAPTAKTAEAQPPVINPPFLK